jgi:hypothetical protein
VNGGGGGHGECIVGVYSKGSGRDFGLKFCVRTEFCAIWDD